ncbi:MAG: hypothetical protein Q8R79_02470 [Legionellaceae bacterium]|nr:hypothetical protein [Legionellaceae bacterium]
MNDAHFESLDLWIQHVTAAFKEDKEVEFSDAVSFLQNPGWVTELLEFLIQLTEKQADDNEPIYSASIYAIDVCLAQLQSAMEEGNKIAAKQLQNFMHKLTHLIEQGQRGLPFWLPVLNALYDMHVVLTPELQEAYQYLVDIHEDQVIDPSVDPLQVMRDMIQELSDLSSFEIAEHFFSQSYAMPPDFFADFVFDLYSIPEGEDIALLTLLHPNAEVRDIVVQTLDSLIEQLTLSSTSLTRLQTIQRWYGAEYHARFQRWIHIQRKKGVVFARPVLDSKIQYFSTEVDGSGAQGLFVQMSVGRKRRLGGILLKQKVGIKDVWLTPWLSIEQVKEYYQQSFSSSVSLSPVTGEYIQEMVNHMLALMMEQHNVPDLQLLALQESSGLDFRPLSLDVGAVMEQVSVGITPFTPAIIEDALDNTRTWIRQKSFAASWFWEDPEIDAVVNRCCTIVQGVKVCALEKAVTSVLEEIFEPARQQCMFHFLWVALWARARTRARQPRIWQDSFLIAYAIYHGRPLREIPLILAMAHRTVLHSIETMGIRRTHLGSAE